MSKTNNKNANYIKFKERGETFFREDDNAAAYGEMIGKIRVKKYSKMPAHLQSGYEKYTAV